jgi:hypothetical protein
MLWNPTFRPCSSRRQTAVGQLTTQSLPQRGQRCYHRYYDQAKAIRLCSW